MNARHPEMPTSRTPRIVAVIAALFVTAVMFDGVASLSALDSADGHIEDAKTVVALAETTVVR